MDVLWTKFLIEQSESVIVELHFRNNPIRMLETFNWVQITLLKYFTNEENVYIYLTFDT